MEGEEKKRKAIKVWNSSRKVKKFVVGADSYEDLLKKGSEKLGIEAVKMVLEEDGTEIDSEDYLDILNSNSVVILLEQMEQWTEKGELPVTETTHSVMGKEEKYLSGGKRQSTLQRDLSLGPTIEDVKANTEEDILKQAMIYGKDNSKVLNTYQRAVNEAAGRLAASKPQLLIKRGDLYDKAREQVKVEGYAFKRGFSRSNSSAASSCSSSDNEPLAPTMKRAKRDKEERKRETDNLASMLENVKGHLQIKQNRLEKAKSVHDYKLCDQLSLDLRQLLKEKNDLERQMAAIQRKEAKSAWYYKGKSAERSKQSSAGKYSKKPLHGFFVAKGGMSPKGTGTSSINSGSTLTNPSIESEKDVACKSSESTAELLVSGTCTTQTATETATPASPPSPTDTLILDGSSDDNQAF